MCAQFNKFRALRAWFNEFRALRAQFISLDNTSASVYYLLLDVRKNVILNALYL